MNVRNFIVLICLLLTCIYNCGVKSPLSNEDEKNDSHVMSLYAIRKETDKSYQLYYTKFDSIRFKKIKGCYYINTEFINKHSLYINKKNELLVLASQHKLFIISLQNNQKIGEVDIPNTINPEHYIGYGVIQIYPCPWSSDHCILINRSVYLINLKSLTIERVIWDSGNTDKVTYIHEDAISDDGKNLYLSLTFLGMWNYGESWRYEMRQRLSELDLETGQMNTIYNYPIEEAPGSKFIFSCRDYIMSYDPNKNYILKFPALSAPSIDTIKVDQFFYPDSYSDGDGAIIQDMDTGSFYKVYRDKNAAELLMQFLFHRSKDGMPGIYGTTFQKMKGGDIYACIPYTSDDKCLIVDLSQQILVRQFNNNSIISLILKED